MSSPAQTFVCLECGVTGITPRHIGAGVNMTVVLISIVGFFVLYWADNSAPVYAPMLVGFGILFLLLAVLGDLGLKVTERFVCPSCLSPRVVPATSPIGRHVLNTVATAAQSPRSEAPSLSAQAAIPPQTTP